MYIGNPENRKHRYSNNRLCKNRNLFSASLFESKWLNVALYFIVNFLFLTVYCFRNWSSAFFHSSMLTAVMVLCELMVYYIITYFAPHFFTKGEYFHHLFIFTIFSKPMFFTVIYVLSHFLKSRQGHDEQPRKSIFLLTLIPVTSVFVMLTFIRISDSCTFSRPLNRIITLSAVFLLAINLLIFGINQYEQKKIWNLHKCSYCFKKNRTPHSIIK